MIFTLLESSFQCPDNSEVYFWKFWEKKTDKVAKSYPDLSFLMGIANF